MHDDGNKDGDLSGENVLLSWDFYYFGSRAIKLPDHLLPIRHQTQGHKSLANAPYFEPFVRWIRSAVSEPGQLYGWPDLILEWNTDSSRRTCRARADDDKNDPPC